jgi:tRNA A37 threonylcarbamoyladenosine synthetase subunit TsaC/SUA5/YrdC
MTDPVEIRGRLEKQLNLVIDGGFCGTDLTTLVDLSGDEPKVLREGKGDPSPFL